MQSAGIAVAPAAVRWQWDLAAEGPSTDAALSVPQYCVEVHSWEERWWFSNILSISEIENNSLPDNGLLHKNFQLLAIKIHTLVKTLRSAKK